MEQLTIKNGNIYLNSSIYETYFSSVKAVVLLKREEGVLLMPVQNASGGLLLKIINAKGDRIVHASEFFMFNDIESQNEQTIDAHWKSDMAALLLKIECCQTKTS